MEDEIRHANKLTSSGQIGNKLGHIPSRVLKSCLSQNPRSMVFKTTAFSLQTQSSSNTGFVLQTALLSQNFVNSQALAFLSIDNVGSIQFLCFSQNVHHKRLWLFRSNRQFSNCYPALLLVAQGSCSSTAGCCCC